MSSAANPAPATGLVPPGGGVAGSTPTNTEVLCCLNDQLAVLNLIIAAVTPLAQAEPAATVSANQAAGTPDNTSLLANLQEQVTVIQLQITAITPLAQAEAQAASASLTPAPATTTTTTPTTTS